MGPVLAARPALVSKRLVAAAGLWTFAGLNALLALACAYTFLWDGLTGGWVAGGLDATAVFMVGVCLTLLAGASGFAAVGVR